MGFPSPNHFFSPLKSVTKTLHPFASAPQSHFMTHCGPPAKKFALSHFKQRYDINSSPKLVRGKRTLVQFLLSFRFFSRISVLIWSATVWGSLYLLGTLHPICGYQTQPLPIAFRNSLRQHVISAAATTHKLIVASPSRFVMVAPCLPLCPAAVALFPFRCGGPVLTTVTRQPLAWTTANSDKSGCFTGEAAASLSLEADSWQNSSSALPDLAWGVPFF